MNNKDIKILVVDIETAPNLSYTWGKWEQDVIEFKKDWYILSFVAKWYGSNKIISVSLPDFPEFKKDKENDMGVVTELWKLFNEADVIVAHNGNAFDIKKANARFIIHGLNPPEPYKQIDTKLVAKRYFKFDSNSLDDLGRQLGLGRKESTGGFQLWVECMAGNQVSWNKKMKYNKQDVLLLEKIYTKLRPWMTNHPNVNVVNDLIGACPTCGGTHLQKRGFNFTRVSRSQRYHCQDCGAWSAGKAERTNIEIR